MSRARRRRSKVCQAKRSNALLQRHHRKLWPEIIGPEWVVLSFAFVAAVYAFEVGGVLVKEPSVLAFAVRKPLVMGKQPLLRPPLNLLLVFQFVIRFFVIDDRTFRVYVFRDRRPSSMRRRSVLSHRPVVGWQKRVRVVRVRGV